jgi:hypothetical protein
MNEQEIGYKAKSFEGRNLAFYFLLAFGITWTTAALIAVLGLDMSASGSGMVKPLNVLIGVMGSISPSFAAFVVTGFSEGKAGVKALWKRFWNRNMSLKWLVVILFFYDAFRLIANLIARAVDGQAYPIIDSSTNHQQRDSLLPFFLLTFLITWGLGALAIFLPLQFQRLFGELTDTSPMYFIAVAAPTISATLLTFVRGGWTDLGSLYGPLVRWRFGLKWYALVLLGIPAAGWIAARITGASPLKEANTTEEFIVLMFYILATGPLCEELGWRGFALPRLLKRFSPFTASLILGVV